MNKNLQLHHKAVGWVDSPDIRPYIYMRKENLFSKPGSKLECGWFTNSPIIKNPLAVSDVNFADQILNLEAKAFQKSGMPMPRWVFYDCAIMPGFVCGFAQKTSTLSKHYKSTVGIDENLDWTPLSLFIIIPTVRKGEWVAHNLCTSNSLIDKNESKYALGFLTKAFGLWYANVEILCGMTQWQSPAIRLHSSYGPFEVLTAYTPVHSYARTLTYRTKLDFSYWPSFLNHKGYKDAIHGDKPAFLVDPKSDESLKSFQRKIEDGGGPFFLSSKQIRTSDLAASLSVFRL